MESNWAIESLETIDFTLGLDEEGNSFDLHMQ
jgi:hypothetical protein